MGKMVGKKPLVTPEMRAEFCGYLAQGLTNKGACSAVGINEATLYDWLNKGDEAIRKLGKTGRLTEREQLYADFKLAYRKAEADFKITHLKNIKRHAVKSWQASAFLLERKFPEEYGRFRHEVEITGSNGGPVQVEEQVHVYLPDNGRDKK